MDIYAAGETLDLKDGKHFVPKKAGGERKAGEGGAEAGETSYNRHGSG